MAIRETLAGRVSACGAGGGGKFVKVFCTGSQWLIG
jgi:hypothetical protein